MVISNQYIQILRSTLPYVLPSGSHEMVVASNNQPRCMTVFPHAGDLGREKRPLRLLVDGLSINDRHCPLAAASCNR